jgi:3-oxosteroid 1-dehydrogenase
MEWTVNHWNDEVDIVVVGTGAAGLTAALTAAEQGLSALAIEKTAFFGGTTSLSGGVMWIPNNHLMRKAGLEDSPELALEYLKHNIGNRVAGNKLASFVEHAPRMLEFLTKRGFLDVVTFEGFPDYRAETPGGLSGGRSVEPKVFAGNKLKAWYEGLRRRKISLPIVGTMTELRQLAAIRSDLGVFLKAWRVLPRQLMGLITGAKHHSTGSALIGWLAHALQQQKIPLRLNCALSEILTENGSVKGIVAIDQGEEVRVRCRKGVILASGGFDHNTALREKYLGGYGGAELSSGSPGNEGDALKSVSELDVALDLMDDAWWAPTCLIPGRGPQIVIFERGKPGQIIVSKEGQRFANEAQPYNDFVKAMFEAQRSGLSALPSFMVFDQRFRDRYPLADMMPGITPKAYIDHGFLIRADNLADLAVAAGIDPEGLTATVEEFNEMARLGVDTKYHRGEFAFDRFSGDSKVSPNCCLAPLEKPPFYALQIHAGDLGTKGGLLTNEYAQVLRVDSEVIDGLYAAGNCSASVMGNFYPGAGGTIGPAMTFGYIAAMHAASRR